MVKEYVKRIMIIIFLTLIPSFLILLANFRLSSAWILGSLASAANFWWMSSKLTVNEVSEEAKAKTGAFKAFYIRYIFLTVYSVLVVILLNPDILVFGFGLLNAQISIYLNELYERIRKSKWLKNDNTKLK